MSQFKPRISDQKGKIRMMDEEPVETPMNMSLALRDTRFLFFRIVES